jgi:hypothetical protein
MTMTQQQMAQAHLDLPVTALPSCRYEDEDNSWQSDAWATLCRVAAGEGTAQTVCGTRLVLTSSRYSEQIIIE